MTESAQIQVQRVVRPLDLSKGEWVSADGLDEPVYLSDPETMHVWFGCGDEHRPDDSTYEHGCGTAYCHGRKGDDR